MPTPLQKFLIAPLKSGYQSNVKPWLIANDAYQILRNAYTWRGRVKKRVGARVMKQSVPINQQQQFTRFRLQVATTDPITGDATGFVPRTGFVPNATPAIGQMFSIGNDYFTVDTLGAPADLLSTNLGVLVHTYDTTSGFATSGQFIFNNATPNAPVYFYPATPVMALQLYNQQQINDELTIGFDTQFSYEWSIANGWTRSGTATQGLWSGTNSQFHWTVNWRGAQSSDYILFVVNNNPPDGIQYMSTTAPNTRNWFTMPPPIINNAGNTLLTALAVTPFKGRLCFFSPTFQIGANQVTFSNAVIISQFGSPFDANAFNTDIVGKGIFLVAPTKESFISLQYLKDRLILFFENSTWEFVFTNNTAFPFNFQKINTELGLESTHSVIPFDKVAIGMGSTGIHACTGINVQRIDDLIPYTIFDIRNTNAGPQRVYGIRDYFEELCYWTYPSNQETYNTNNVFPNRVLIYDYVNSTWAFNDDSITAFGYFYLQDNLLVWQNITSTWQEMTQEWEDFESEQLFRSVIAGNQEGWTFIVQPDLERNSMSLQITNMTRVGTTVTLTIINHNIPPNSWIFLANIQTLNVGGIGMDVLNNTIQQIIWVDANTIQIINVPITALFTTYLGGGTVELVSQINIFTKAYNFFPEQGQYTFISHGDFYVDKTDTGAITVDYYASSSTQDMVTDGRASGALLGTSILETSPYVLSPLEQTQQQFWHRIYFQTLGETIQLNLYFSPTQMVNQEIVFVSFELNGMLFYAKPETMYF